MKCASSIGLSNTFQYEQEAARQLSESVYAFFSGGANDEHSLAHNQEIFQQLQFIPHVLRVPSEVDTHCSLLGHQRSTPLLVAPMAFQRLAHHEGELAVVKATAKRDIPCCISMLSNTALSPLANATNVAPWLQLYFYQNRELIENLIQEAEEIHCGAIVLTVDAPIYGKRERELCSPLILPERLSLPLLEKAGLSIQNIPRHQLTGYLTSLLDPYVGWDDVRWLVQATSLPVLLKGVLHPDDAKTAIDAGVKGLILSNHGGRQLDTVVSPLQVLPDIVDAVEKQVTLIYDGGIRRGTDILKALILGAHGVCLGRPIIWGLAVNGEEGVSSILKLLLDELKLAMHLTGCKQLSDVQTQVPLFARAISSSF